MWDTAASTVGKGVSNSIAQLVERSFLGIMQNSKEGVGILRSKFAIGFERYISTTRSRCTNVKTLISSHHPVLLEKAYEPARLSLSAGTTIHVDNFLDDLERLYKRSLITATLGAGKSFTMRYIYSVLSSVEVMNRIPIFVELRYVDFKNGNLINYIRDELAIHNSFTSERTVRAGLKAGAFSLVLDGFDEISLRQRESAQKQILKISDDYPNCVIIVSSRPDTERFISWHAFSEHEVQPLSLDELKSMISRIEYDATDKSAFLDRVENGLFKTHEKLLSNPLLASMMLLTFREFQDIPSKMHVFYGTAFNVLFRRHDATKTSYHREFRTALELEEFKKIFMTFCFTSFVDKRFSFSEKEFKHYSDLASDYEGIKVNSDDFEDDLLKQVCIVQKEGEKITFIHRSFQEYFSALFLSKRSIDESFNFIDFVVRESASGSECANMLIDIDREEFERKYLIERVRQFIEEYEHANSDRKKIEFLSDSFIFGRFDDESRVYLSPWHRNRNSHSGNYYLVVALASAYELPVYVSYEYANTGWWKYFKKELREEEHLRLLRAEDIPLKAARGAGLISYSNSVFLRTKRLAKSLQDKHDRKRRLLSNTFRKTK